MRRLKTPQRDQLVVALLLGALGFAAITQVQDHESDSYGSLREQDLIDLLDGLDGAGDRGAGELAELEREQQDLLTETSRRQDAHDRARAETDILEILAGLVPVTGPGVRITITPGERQLPLTTLTNTISVLRLNQAEAIEVNDQVRIALNDAIEQSNTGFTFSDEQIEPPYVLDVIGSPELLADGMDFPDGPRDRVEKVGGELRIKRSTSISITSISAMPDIDESRPFP